MIEKLSQALTAGLQDSQNAEKTLRDAEEVSRDAAEQVQALKEEIKSSGKQLRLLAAILQGLKNVGERLDHIEAHTEEIRESIGGRSGGDTKGESG